MTTIEQARARFITTRTLEILEDHYPWEVVHEAKEQAEREWAHPESPQPNGAS